MDNALFALRDGQHKGQPHTLHFCFSLLGFWHTVQAQASPLQDRLPWPWQLESTNMKEVPFRYECSNKLHTDYEMPRDWTPLRIFATGNRGFGTVPSEFLSSNGSLSVFPCMTCSISHFDTSNEAATPQQVHFVDFLFGGLFGLHLDPNKLAHCAELKGEYLDLACSFGIKKEAFLLCWIGGPHSIALTSHSVTLKHLEHHKAEGYNRYHQGKALKQTQNFRYNLLSLGQN